MREKTTLLIRHARELLTLDGPPLRCEAPGEHAPLGVVCDGAVACAGGVIVALGPTASVERAIDLADDALVIDAHDALIAPGLVDAHTHALFVGDRAHEFTMRLEGATYAEIAAQGGGIASSVRALRAADDATLASALHERLQSMRAYGVTAVEIKSGYGLDTRHEVRAIRAIHRARATAGVRIASTFLPLHAVDPDLRAVPDGRTRFLERSLRETLPAALSEHPDFIDAYVDSTGFSVDECRPLITAARDAGLRARLHVGQFADVGGAEFAAELGASSADHLEHVSDAGLTAMARAGVVGVVLPGAAFSLGQSWPDARRMRALGVDVAIATDCNPGTSHTDNLPLMAAFAVRWMGLTTVEAWWGLTRAPARSLGLASDGRLRVGHPADLCVLALPSWEALPYQFGSPRALGTALGGVWRALGPRA